MTPIKEILDFIVNSALMGMFIAFVAYITWRIATKKN